MNLIKPHRLPASATLGVIAPGTPITLPAMGLDYGHTDPLLTLPIGIEAELDADAGTLTLLESATVLSGRERD